MDKRTGKFVVSLDFELMWGVRDVTTVDKYGENIKGVYYSLPLILDYFKKFGVKGTFAIVGFLYFDSRKDLLENSPVQRPGYLDTNLSPYGDYIEKKVGTDSHSDPLHFAPGLIRLIQQTPDQEIGTHTFSHFYCLEKGQCLEDFRQDLSAAIKIANQKGINITSIVFPRNQTNESYLQVCKSMGITNYRSNEDSWIYSAQDSTNESTKRRIFRLLDTYVNISGYHCHTDEVMKNSLIINIPSSRFLRPYTPKLRLLESLRLKRIKDSMTHAAKNGLTYHLWWHPHNFGVYVSENFAFLEKILLHYQYLHLTYGFESYTMSQVAQQLSTSRVKLQPQHAG